MRLCLYSTPFVEPRAPSKRAMSILSSSFFFPSLSQYALDQCQIVYI